MSYVWWSLDVSWCLEAHVSSCFYLRLEDESIDESIRVSIRQGKDLLFLWAWSRWSRSPMPRSDAICRWDLKRGFVAPKRRTESAMVCTWKFHKMPSSCFSLFFHMTRMTRIWVWHVSKVCQYTVHLALLKTCVISGRMPLNLAQLSVCHVPKLSSLQAVPVLQLFSLCLCFKSFSLPL